MFTDLRYGIRTVSCPLGWPVSVRRHHPPWLQGGDGGASGCPEHHGGSRSSLIPRQLCHGLWTRLCLACVSLPQAIGSFGAGLIDIEELHKIERCALPGSGACGETIT